MLRILADVRPGEKDQVHRKHRSGGKPEPLNKERKMNNQIKELAEQCTTQYRDGNGGYIDQLDTEKFAELIVKECIHKMLNSDDEHFMNLEGWDLGGPNHNAWTRGVLDSVAVVREHFGVEK